MKNEEKETKRKEEEKRKEREKKENVLQRQEAPQEAGKYVMKPPTLLATRWHSAPTQFMSAGVVGH